MGRDYSDPRELRVYKAFEKDNPTSLTLLACLRDDRHFIAHV